MLVEIAYKKKVCINGKNIELTELFYATDWWKNKNELSIYFQLDESTTKKMYPNEIIYIREVEK